jgi:hypothetical protein
MTFDVFNLDIRLHGIKLGRYWLYGKLGRLNGVLSRLYVGNRLFVTLSIKATCWKS